MTAVKTIFVATALAAFAFVSVANGQQAPQAGTQSATQAPPSKPSAVPQTDAPPAAGTATPETTKAADPVTDATAGAANRGTDAATAAPGDGTRLAPAPAASNDTPRDKTIPSPAPQQFAASTTSFDQAVDRTIAREHQYVQTLQKFAPLVETYIQDLKYDKDLGSAPSGDNYFLGRLQLTTQGPGDKSYLPQPGFFRSMLKKVNSLYSLEFLPLGFAQMTMIDNTGFDRQHYDFKFLKREFLGDTRCIVMDVVPKKGTGAGRFIGRIWVEDQDFNVVRANGTYSGSPHFQRFLHFDAWRLNMQPGLWLPAYIYSEESDLAYRFGTGHLKFKALTRLWGYDLKNNGSSSEFTEVQVDQPNIKDRSDAGQDLTPVESQRAWQRQAEDNALDRLQRAGILAAPSDVDKILQTVVNNLEVTNNLDIQPDVRCRVMLTTPLESFSIGHTIILSRGLIDVLPDEATLAAVLAHELAHVALGHKFDTRWAFSDRTLFPDEQSFRRMNFHHKPDEEAAADAKALDYLKNSPYKDKLNDIGLFMKALALREHVLPNLIQAHLGNTMMVDKGKLRMAPLENSAPQLQMRDTKQIPALPMGSRLRLDPWSDRVDLVKGKPVPLQSASEKLLFEVTPVFPYITRYSGTPAATASAANTPPNQ
ncbi:MAG TPA: M48 family metalloprotease [Terriglobales bacterium]|nr:M48 family metalloprotease [Terriglobales bacterium]